MNEFERHLTKGVYGYEDVKAGDWYSTPTQKITANIIDAFADLSGDHFEIHMSKEAAIRHGFSGRVAHGLLILSLVDGLKNQADVQFKAQASLGWNWRFSRPVIIGETIRPKVRVLDISEPKSKERAIISLDFLVTNQNGETVQEGSNRLMVYK
ncbi:MAG: MaoC family dehydratase [Hyphomicrobiales bacterium]